MGEDTTNIVNVDTESFARVVLEGSAQRAVLVDFWAEWCGPCRSLTPILERLAGEHAGRLILAKINSDEERDLALQFEVRSLPTVKLFRNGRVVDEFIGLQPESHIRAMLEEHLPRESDAKREQARQLLDDGRASEACEVLRSAMASDPGNARLPIDLVHCLLELGEVTEADEILAALPADARADDPVRTLEARIHLARLANETSSAYVLERSIDANPHDCDARFQLSALLSASGEYERAMGELLEILRRDKHFREDAARKTMLVIFQVLGADNPLVGRYRDLMSSTLH